jgi:hypothetical protein
MTETVANKTTARIAGLLYLGVVLTGVFTLMYVPSKLIVSDNAALTYQNIVTHESLFRLGIIGGLLCYTFFFYPLPCINY